MKFRMSDMASNVLVVEVEDRDEGTVVERLSDQNHGYAIRGTEYPVAVIDGRIASQGWCTPDHLLAIEAHELGHILADTDDEPTAEAKAIEILTAHGHTAAVKLLRERGVLVE
jgi:hypothetical protein